VIGFAFVLTARRESVAVNGCPEGEVLVGTRDMQRGWLPLSSAD
jgi:hypothetical protein